MDAVLLEPRPKQTPEDACPHAQVRALGTDANTTFVRCLACDRILIVQGGRAWTLRA